MSLKEITSNHKRVLGLTFSLLFVVAYLLHPQAETWLQPVALIILGVCICIFLLNTPPGDSDISVYESFSTPLRRTYLVLLLLAWLMLTILVEINTGYLKISVFSNTHQHIQMLLLLSAVGLIIIAFVDWRRLLTTPKLTIWIPILLTLFALTIRLWGLQTGVSVPLADEYAFLDTAVALWDKPDYPMLEPIGEGYLFPWTHPYMVLSSMEILGWDLWQARLPSAIFGALAIPALYSLAYHLFDRPIAVVACVILATFPPHIHLSRMILNNIYDTTMGICALALIASGFKRSNPAHFVLAGVMLAFTQYFYEAGRILFPPLAIMFSLILLWCKQRSITRSHITALIKGAFAFITLALPIYITLYALDHPFFGRFELVAPSGENVQYVIENTTSRNILSDDYVERLGGTLLHFVQRLDNSPEFYGGSQAMILTLIVPVFLLGIFVIIRYWRWAGHQLLMIWLLAAILGIAFVRIGAWTARFTPVFPAIALIIAIGLAFLVRVMVNRRGQMVGIIIGTVLIAGIQVNYYFGEHLETYNAQAHTLLDETDAFHRATALPEGTVVNYIDDQGIFMPYLITLMRLWQRVDLQIVHYFYEEVTSEQLAIMIQAENPQVFFIDPALGETLARIEQFFLLDGPYLSPHSDVPQHRQYALYYAVNR